MSLMTLIPCIISLSTFTLTSMHSRRRRSSFDCSKTTGSSMKKTTKRAMRQNQVAFLTELYIKVRDMMSPSGAAQSALTDMKD